MIRLVGIDCTGTLLDEGAGIGIDMLLKLVDLHDGVMRTDGEAEPPASHGVGLAEAVGHNQAVTDFRIARKPDLGITGVDQLLIHLIGDDPRVIFQRERHQQVDFLFINTVVGNHVKMYDTNRCIVHVPRNKVVVIQGLEDYIVVENNDMLLICKKSEEQQIRQYVTDIQVDFGREFV